MICSFLTLASRLLSHTELVEVSGIEKYFAKKHLSTEKHSVLICNFETQKT